MVYLAHINFSFLSVWTDKSRSLALGGRSAVPFGIAICFPLAPPSSSSLVGGGGRADVLGTIKRDTQIREIKIAKKEMRQITQDHQGSGAGSVSPGPLASGTSSTSPDPHWAQAQVLPHLTPLGLGHKFRLTRVPISVPGFQRTMTVSST